MSYGSLDKYKMCNKSQKPGLGVSRLILSSVFLAACIYFALLVMSSIAAPLASDTNSNHIHVVKEHQVTDPCLPLLDNDNAPPLEATQEVTLRSAEPPSGLSTKKAAGAAIALGLLSGYAHAFSPSRPFRRADGNEPTSPAAFKHVYGEHDSTDTGSPALAVARYRSCKREHDLAIASSSHTSSKGYR